MSRALITTDVINTIIERVESGQTFTAAVKAAGFTPWAMYRAIERYPNFGAALERARKTGAAALADEVIEIADTEENAKKGANRMKARQWLASKLDPKTFGDKLDLTVTEHIDMTSARERGRTRALRPVSDQHGVVYAVIPSESATSDAELTGKEPASDVPDLDIFK
jgi:hypothetical protein